MNKKKHVKHVIDSFRKLSKADKLETVKEMFSLSLEEMKILSGETILPDPIADSMIENVIGLFALPIGLATHFVIDENEYLIPMVVEESSIVAAASATAKWVVKNGAITTFVKGNLIIGQIQLPCVQDSNQVSRAIETHREALIRAANECVPGLVRRGGGIKDLTVRVIHQPFSPQDMVVIHILCDPCDAMGANLINQVSEALKPQVEMLTGEKVGMCILSNLVDTKLTGAEIIIRNIAPHVGAGIVEATRFAKADPYRAATHNKGVMNGIDPVLVATGNDWRAAEAGIHAFAARSGRYQPITDWIMDGKDLRGKIEIPLALGIAGGVTQLHPTAKIMTKILGITSSEELARVCCAVGLVQNLGALKALSTDGIVKGHMRLHAVNLALAAGAEPSEVAEVCHRLADQIIDKKTITLSSTQEVLNELRNQRGNPMRLKR